MNINQISNVTPMANRIQSRQVAKNQNNAVSFEGKNIIKAAMVSAPLILAMAAVPLKASAQDNIQGGTQAIGLLPPKTYMGKYFTENGFTTEQRIAIADYAEEYAKKYLEESQNGYAQAYLNCPYLSEKDKLYISNPAALNSSFYMDKINNAAKDLTKFRNDMILCGAIRYDGYVPNPELNPVEDNKEAIEEILGEGVTYEQYVKDNAETIKKLDNIDLIGLSKLSDKEMDVYTKMRQIILLNLTYIHTKEIEYTKEAEEGMEKKIESFENDMNKLETFRNETEPLKNTFITKTFDEDGIITDFEYRATDEGFRQAVSNVYREIVITGIDTPKSNEKSTGLTYDLSGRIINNPTKGIIIKDGKKIFVK